MGLAASQARFLNLTARKTNLEYEGQQINQQRTMLANESANYYSQMLTLTVPVPPQESSFSTVVYNFTLADGDARTINQVTGSDSSANIICTKTYIDNYNMAEIKDQNRAAIASSIMGQEKKLLSEYEDSANILVGINDKLGANYNASDIYCYVKGSGKNISYEYYLKSAIDGTDPVVTGYKPSAVTKYGQEFYENVQITRDASNRIAAMTCIKEGKKLFENLAVTAATVKDEVAYNEAFADYQYQTYLYQQQMDEINAQTSVIQAQDKKLELRLKQLDTEQNAVSTEMDNITNLIDKNIENTFKIFA